MNAQLTHLRAHQHIADLQRETHAAAVGRRRRGAAPSVKPGPAHRARQAARAPSTGRRLTWAGLVGLAGILVTLLLAAPAGAMPGPYTDTGLIAAYDAHGQPIVVGYYDRSGGAATPLIAGDSQSSFIQFLTPNGGPVAGNRFSAFNDNCTGHEPWPYSTAPTSMDPSDPGYQNLCWEVHFNPATSTPGTYGILMPPSVVVGGATEVFDHWNVTNAITTGKCHTGDMGVGVVDGDLSGSTFGSGDPFPSGPEYRIWTDVTNNLGMGAAIEARYASVSPDTTAPFVTIAPAIECAVVEQHSSTLQAAFSCQEPFALVGSGISTQAGPPLGSGVASCVGTDAAGTVQDADPLDTSSVGAHTFTVNTTDVAGNARSRTVGYCVVSGPNAPPPLSVASDRTVEATGAGGATVSYTAPTACDGQTGAPLTPSCSQASGSVFPLGTTTVSCSVTDSSGVTTSGSFKITVQDTTRPTLTLPGDIAAQATGANGAAVSYSAAATDLVDGSVPVICNHASGSTFPVGTTTVNCSATDAHNNAANGSFRVTVSAVYAIAAFGQPINDPMNPMSVFKGGSTVPVKFQLTDQGGNPIDDADASTIAAACQAKIGLQYLSSSTGPVDEVVNSTTANSGSCFRYDATSHTFMFNLGTKGLSTGAYKITATVTGSFAATHSVQVGLH